MRITKVDLTWNFAATFLKIASAAVLLPFILKMMPAEMVGIWTIFITITAFSSLLDFGFAPSFTRNITYVFSGVKELKKNGFETIGDQDKAIDYGLLKGVIDVMRWFYLRMAIILFVLLVTLGTYYIYTLLQNYKGNQLEVYIAWMILCIISTYNLFTLYYASLLLGKGLVKESKKITIIGQVAYLIIAAVFILLGFGLIAIVSAQAISVIIIRLLSYRAFFTKEIKQNLSNSKAHSKKNIFNSILPNAVKIGITSLGGFMVNKSSIIFGSFYLSLEEIASYGITLQLMIVIPSLALIYINTYQPKIVQLRVEKNIEAIKVLYIRGQIFMSLTFIVGSLALIFIGQWALNLINSATPLIPSTMLIVALIILFLENNHAVAGGILLTKNEVPFFKASLFAGAITLILLFLLLQYTQLNLWAMIIAPGIAQGLYQNWKWPKDVKNELKIKRKDIASVILKTLKKN
jgi:O-antigen/teichoic acid export membrane protein